MCFESKSQTEQTTETTQGGGLSTEQKNEAINAEVKGLLQDIEDDKLVTGADLHAAMKERLTTEQIEVLAVHHLLDRYAKTTMGGGNPLAAALAMAMARNSRG